MKRSILIVSEGEHELGSGQPNAALTTLVQRLLGSHIDLQAECRRIRELSGHIHPGRGDRLGRKFVGIIRLAERQDFDAVVILIDQDGDRSRPASATFAQDTSVTLMRRAVGIAIRSFDAWFLADHASLSEVLGIAVAKQPDPESTADPKQRCRQLAVTSECPLSQREIYAHVAARSDLEKLKDRCPAGFAVFAARVERLANELSSPD